MSAGDSSSADDYARICKIIAGALIGGVTSFLAITLVVRAIGDQGLLAAEPWNLASREAILSLISVVFAATAAGVSLAVPDVVANSLRRQVAAGKYPSAANGRANDDWAFRRVYQTRMIIGLALLEGAAFFCLIAFMLEGRLLPVIGGFILISLMASRFPSREAMDRFVEDQEAKILEERHAA